MRPYIESFLPLFVAINPAGIIPIYLSVTENLSTAERRRGPPEQDGGRLGADRGMAVSLSKIPVSLLRVPVIAMRTGRAAMTSVHRARRVARSSAS